MCEIYDEQIKMINESDMPEAEKILARLNAFKQKQTHEGLVKVQDQIFEMLVLMKENKIEHEEIRKVHSEFATEFKSNCNRSFETHHKNSTRLVRLEEYRNSMKERAKEYGLYATIIISVLALFSG